MLFLPFMLLLKNADARPTTSGLFSSSKNKEFRLFNLVDEFIVE